MASTNLTALRTSQPQECDKEGSEDTQQKAPSPAVVRILAALCRINLMTWFWEFLSKALFGALLSDASKPTNNPPVSLEENHDSDHVSHIRRV